MSWIVEKELNEKRSVNAAAMKSLLEQGELNAERSAQFDKLHAEEQGYARQAEAIKIAQNAERSVSEMIGRDSNGFKLDTNKDAVNHAKRKRLFGHDLTQDEQRTLLSAGGAFVPETLSTEFVKVGQTFRGVIAAGARHINTSNAGPYLVPKLNDVSSVGEMLAAENTESSDQDYSESQVSLPVYKFSSKAIYLTKNYVRDSQLQNLEGELAAMGADRIFKAANTYFTTGSGSSQPQGCVNGSTAGKTFASPTAITYAEVLDLIHSLGEQYRQDAVLMFNDTTLLALRKIVASDNRPLWGEGNVIAGVPETLGGCRFVVNTAMANIGASNKPILYGNFKQGYTYRTVGDAPEVNLLPINKKLELGWIFDLDMGGAVVDTTAIKHGVHPAS